MVKISKRILIIGTRHGAQDKGHFKKRLEFLKSKKFSKNFIKIETNILLKMREELIKIIEKFNPDIIFEECSPWIKKPGDTWKKYTGSKKTILENRYPKKHLFVDAKMLKSGKKPSLFKREKAIVEQIIKTFKKNKLNKAILVIGRTHLKKITKLLRKSSFKVLPRDLSEKRNLKKLIKKWRILHITQPRNISKEVEEKRKDVKLIDGGLIKTPGVNYHFNFGIPREVAFACLTETMILACENINSPYSLGKVEIEKVKEILKLAEEYRFSPFK